VSPTRLACVLALSLACNASDPGDDPGTDASTTDASTTDVTDASGTSTGELTPPDGYWLPLACGATARVGQGNDSDFSHNGLRRYAFDILLAPDTPVHAMAGGVVWYVYADNQPGDPCHDGGDEQCQPYANLVALRHGDGASSVYKHLNSVAVGVGERVARGGVVGGSGSTGWSTTPHVHVAREQDCGEVQCQSIPLEFVDAGVPVTGQRVTSANCP
jgi:murein DD-endopeptidase MepM/ murein hydrolase activator NlpD